jgi:uncharacterized protein (TIGR03663 family)
MKHALVLSLWICVIATGGFLRLDQLAERPFHADEATGAFITGQRMTEDGGHFDPTHYHGPLLGDLAIPLCRLVWQRGWQDMKKSTLRAVPVISGILLLGLPFLGRRRFGDGPMLLAAAVMATSPLLVYYSRMFIHESLLVLFGIAVLFAILEPGPPFSKIRWGVIGVLLGLMFATKESFAISIIAWSAAGILVAWEHRKHPQLAEQISVRRKYLIPLGILAATAAITAGYFYTNGFRHPQGAIDAVRTFFVYKTAEGHDKPPAYYLTLLALPQKAGGFWWFGTPAVILALLAYASTFRRSAEGSPSRATIRFLAYATAGHFIIYSIIAYKTPWLACLPWAHLCLLAGFSLSGFSRNPAWLKAVIAALLLTCLITQTRQTRIATGRLESDARNPFAYVPSRPDLESLEAWLKQLQTTLPGNPLDSAAVIGTDYWPLPWYLRSFENTGYWAKSPDDLTTFPLVFAAPDAADSVAGTLAGTHTLVPRGLRAGVPLHTFLRNDIWTSWLESHDH